jgi:hypothetical protein
MGTIADGGGPGRCQCGSCEQAQFDISRKLMVRLLRPVKVIMNRLLSLRSFACLLVFYSAGASALTQSLSFRLDQTSGEVIAITSGFLANRCDRPEPPPLISVQETTVTISIDYEHGGSGGYCIPETPPEPTYYEVGARVGHLTAPLYTVIWRRRVSSSHFQVILTMPLEPNSLTRSAIPTLSAIELAVLGVILAISGFITIQGRNDGRVP